MGYSFRYSFFILHSTIYFNQTTANPIQCISFHGKWEWNESNWMDCVLPAQAKWICLKWMSERKQRMQPQPPPQRTSLTSLIISFVCSLPAILFNQTIQSSMASALMNWMWLKEWRKRWINFTPSINHSFLSWFILFRSINFTVILSSISSLSLRFYC